jgi:hypothetical protein
MGGTVYSLDTWAQASIEKGALYLTINRYFQLRESVLWAGENANAKWAEVVRLSDVQSNQNELAALCDGHKEISQKPAYMARVQSFANGLSKKGELIAAFSQFFDAQIGYDDVHKELNEWKAHTPAYKYLSDLGIVPPPGVAYEALDMDTHVRGFVAGTEKIRTRFGESFPEQKAKIVSVSSKAGTACAALLKASRARESLASIMGRLQNRIVLERLPYPAAPEQLLEISKLPGFRSGRGIYNLALRAPDKSRLIIQSSLLDDNIAVFEVDPKGAASIRKLKSFTVEKDLLGNRVEKYVFEDGYEISLPPASNLQSTVDMLPP